MEIQQIISNDNLKNKIGKEYEVLVENVSFDGKYLIGRTKQDVPEIDGNVYIKNNQKENHINKFIKIKVEHVRDYDIIGNIIEK